MVEMTLPEAIQNAHDDLLAVDEHGEHEVWINPPQVRALLRTAEAMATLEKWTRDGILVGLGWGPTGWRVQVYFRSKTLMLWVYRDGCGADLSAAVEAAARQMEENDA